MTTQTLTNGQIDFILEVASQIKELARCGVLSKKEFNYSDFPRAADFFKEDTPEEARQYVLAVLKKSIEVLEQP